MSGDLSAAMPALPKAKLVWFKAVCSCTDKDGNEIPFEEWPDAAQRVMRLLLEYGWDVVRRGGIFRFTFTDRQLGRWGRVVRRTIQRGLWWLHHVAKIITRPRIDGSRVITFEFELAGKEKPPPKASPKKTAKPAAVPAVAEPAPEKPATPEERQAWAAEMGAEIRGATDPAPHVTIPGPAEATPGPAAEAKVRKPIVVSSPTIDDEERARRREESRQRQMAAFAARKQLRQVEEQDQPEPPPAPSGADEIRRE
jgi:hypothetical protein